MNVNEDVGPPRDLKFMKKTFNSPNRCKASSFQSPNSNLSQKSLNFRKNRFTTSSSSSFYNNSMDRKHDYHRTCKLIVLQKSVFINDSLITVSTDELEDKIKAVHVKNIDKLQLVNNIKLIRKSTNVINSLLNKFKEKCQDNKVDVPFETWIADAEELRGQCITIRKDNFILKIIFL